MAWRVASLRDVSLLWARKTSAPVIASPTLVDDGVLVADYLGWIMLLDVSDGAPRWAYRAQFSVGSTPVVIDRPEGRSIAFSDVRSTYRVPILPRLAR
jgi:hypothetical protein